MRIKSLLIFMTISVQQATHVCSQTKTRLLLEPYSGVTWTQKYTDHPEGSYRLFKPRNFTGFGLGIERNRWALALDRRGQGIYYKTQSYYPYDSSTRYYSTYLIVSRARLEYSFIKKEKFLSRLVFAYAIPAKTSLFIRKEIIVDKAGNTTTGDDFWYQRAGAYYAGLNFSLRDAADRYRFGLNIGAERLRSRRKSFGEWYNWFDHDKWFFMAGVHVTRVLDLKRRKH